MQKQQSGFTLIELIAVMVILGILAATAVPKFVDLSDSAQQAALNSIAGSLESASALNHAVDIANEAGLTSDTPETVAKCSDAAILLASGALPDTNYTLGGTGGAAGDGTMIDHEIGSCTLSHPKAANDATFALIGAAP